MKFKKICFTVISTLSMLSIIAGAIIQKAMQVRKFGVISENFIIWHWSIFLIIGGAVLIGIAWLVAFLWK